MRIRTLFLLVIMLSFMQLSQASAGKSALVRPKLEELQTDCIPRNFPASSEVSFRGTIIAVHGFTACPQQFFALVGDWQRLGYRVILPLLPGHGRNWVGDKDNFDELPLRKEAVAVYDGFVRTLIDEIREQPGEKIILGISLGGAIALRANQLAPNLFDRTIALAPFLRLSTAPSESARFASIQRALRSALKPTDLLEFGGGRIVVGWGRGCEVTERNFGRAGICNFRITHLAGLERFGATVLFHGKLLNGNVDLIGVENDGAIDNQAIIELRRFLKRPATFCFFPRPANHSLLSRYDSPSEDKFWLPGLEASIANLILNGDSLKIFPEAETLEGVSVCKF